MSNTWEVLLSGIFRGKDTGQPRSGAGVGVGILRATIMFEDLKDSKKGSSENTQIPPSTTNYSNKKIEVVSKPFSI